MKHYSSWVLLTLVLAALPSLFTLPIWVAGIALSGAVLHYIRPLRKGWGGKIAAIALLSATAAGIWFSFESWFNAQAVLSFFIGVVFLKWGESHTRRDYLLLIFAAVVLAAVGALYWENLWSLAHMLVVIFFLTLSLVAIHGDPSVLTRGFLARLSTQLFLLGLPLMLLLFMTFPRIPGPLWDIGLAFGLPVKAMMNSGPSDFGKVLTLEPGAIHEAGKEDGSVVVAEFEGAVPFKSRLYWRGPVFWDYDGENWTLPDSWDNRSRLLKRAIRSEDKLNQELRWKDNPVTYTLRVMPNGGRWLYALDVPAAPAPEAFISDEFQLLSIGKIEHSEPKFKMRSYLDYHMGSELTDVARTRGLAWPENTNPRLLAFGKKIAAESQDSKAIVHQAFSTLASGNYQFDAAHIITPGTDLLDRYFFDEKRGGAEYLAGSFVMLMRAAGVPARLVSGYRGGTIIALTNFVIVKRSDAHAWAEVWHEDTGWVRVEPKDIILPPKRKADKTKVKKEPTADALVEIKQIDGAPPVIKDSPHKNQEPKTSSATQGQRWELPSLTSLLGNLQKWVIHYDPDRQTNLLEGVGLQESNWLDLLIGGALGVLSLLGTYLAVAWWRARAQIDPVTRSWLKFCERLQRLGLPKRPQECPSDYLKRASREKPELADALEDVIGRYINIRYGDSTAPEEIATFKRQVERFVAMT
jgi:transglutaminase-like putative cysteine protease